MSDFRSYDSFEEMQADLAQHEADANANLTPQQIELRDDTDNDRYWVRPYPELKCLIFGVAWSWQRAAEASAKYMPDRDELGAKEHLQELDEAVFEIRQVSESRTRGYLYGDAFSVIEPEGELGGTHVANVWPISREAFEEAKRAGWRAVMSPVSEAGTPRLVEELAELDELRRAYRAEKSREN